MRININQQISIAKHIVDGSITLDSTDEFKSILRIFPSDPALHRAFADHLVRKKPPCILRTTIFSEIYTLP